MGPRAYSGHSEGEKSSYPCWDPAPYSLAHSLAPKLATLPLLHMKLLLFWFCYAALQCGH
jgi:hypothetical protein